MKRNLTEEFRQSMICLFVCPAILHDQDSNMLYWQNILPIMLLFRSKHAQIPLISANLYMK